MRPSFYCLIHFYKRVFAPELQPPGWVTTTFGTPGLASSELGLASARLAATDMVSSGNTT